ncbi:triacylglycerol lipase [Desulforhopalus sp. IMCC35007]|uniref:esterase/lipase family protein n=1 Tax=Desulforhopalus sp. IMCC35007 TaxID=2569543 RepID=UPI0010ADE436|nr:alpha/beta hydrolase [Desulforhopalus sp. IMCC35007]TKB07250.1 alpha/beta hydrolase [Desulforhopalus sp. IMCC35007]
MLIHGMGRNARSMSQMQAALVQEGYFTVNLGSPLTLKNIESIAADDYLLAFAACIELQSARVHFVTHSLGGNILRKALSEEKPDRLRRVVMRNPPDNGSDLVDTIKDRALFKWLMGPAEQQLTTGQDSLRVQLGGADFPLGVIWHEREQQVRIYN